jgi:hypothetical protein
MSSSNTSNAIVRSLVHAIESNSVTPEDALKLTEWSPKEWDNNDSCENEKTVLGGMARRVGGGDTALWLKAMHNLVKTRGQPNSTVWADVLTTVYKKIGQVTQAQKDVTPQVEAWRKLASPEYWNQQGQPVVEMAFNQKHWEEMDAILAAGVSPDTQIKASSRGYGQEDMVPLLAASPCPTPVAICLKHGANPLLPAGQASILEWVEARHENCFEGGVERRDTVKALRQATQKALETASPDLLEKHQQAQLWSTLKTAKSWMDIQNAIQPMATVVKKFRGPNGEPFLFALASEKPEFIPNLMRLKASSEDWWTLTDTSGMNVRHYLALSKANSSYGYRKNSKEKILALLDEKGPTAPKTKEEWAAWHQVLWAWQLKNVDTLSTDPVDAFPEAGTHNVLWVQEPWSLDDAHPAFGKLGHAGLSEFRKDIMSVEGLNRHAELWLELSSQTGSTPPVFNSYATSEMSTQKEYPRMDLKKLASLQKNKFSDAAATLGLRMSLRFLMTLAAEGSWGYRKESSDAERQKEALDVAKAWIQKGASWQALNEDVEKGRTRLARQWRAALPLHAGLREKWHNQWSSALQREELSHKVLPLAQKKSTQEQYGLAL